MSFSAGTMQLVGSGKVTGVTPAQGSPAPNAALDPKASATVPGQLSLSFGVGTGSANIFCAFTVSLAAGASATYDLYTGTDIKDLFGQTAAFRIMRGMEIAIVAGGDSSGVRIGGASSNEFKGWFVSAGDQQDIFPNATPYFASSVEGKALTTSTKNLKVANLGAVEVTLRILLAGSSFASGEFTGLFSGYMTYP
jgi:hypothetical protein